MTDDPRVRSRGAGAAARPGAPGRADADRGWLREAIELSTRCPPSRSAFSVGAVLVSAAGRIIATGYSRERDLAGHAEEAALAKVAAAHQLTAAQLTAAQLTADQLAGVRDLLAGATLYSSLEPCLRRASRPRPCAELIVAAGIRRVVVAWLEPPMFVPGGGAAWLRGAGVTVIEFPELAARARAVNAHLVDHRATEGGAG